MKRFLLTAFCLLFCVATANAAGANNHGIKRYLTKETTVDMKDKKTIFIGWVDMHPEDWKGFGYDSEEEWNSIIADANSALVIASRSDLPERAIVFAKDKNDQNAAGSDLYIKFTDVAVDYDGLNVKLTIHFIDPKTGTEIASIPNRPYLGNEWRLKDVVASALKEVALKLKAEIMADAPGKKAK
jgi:hypothetical protein